jgi:hypothetical protein
MRWSWAFTLLAIAGAGLVIPVPAAAEPTCLTPAAADGHEPVCNPYLGSGVWSAPHRASYAQDSSAYPGPEPGDAIAYQHRPYGDDVPVILQVSGPYPDGKRALWFSTVSAPDARRVYKADYETLAPLGSYDVTEEGRAPSDVPNTSGVYNLLARGNRLVTVRDRTIEVYTDAVPGVRTSDVKLERRFTLPDSALCRSGDRIIGLTLLFTGELAFATVQGVIGVVPIEPDRLNAAHLATASINGAACRDPGVPDDQLEGISNSLAADEDGGIYPVSVRAMYRFDYASGRLTRTWRVPYETGGGGGGARLDEGSGSTPTVMGTDPGDDRFVVITDGQRLMHLVLFWRDRIPPGWRPIAAGKDPRIACETPVDFGDPGATESVSEQSVVVRGYASVVVNNKLSLDTLFATLPPSVRPLSALSAQVPGNEPHGVQRIDWDPRTRTCRSVWANRDVSIPNAVPTMSSRTRLVYGLGLRDRTWGLEALDFASGASRLFVPATAAPYDNSFFAQTTVAADGAIIVGALGGITAFRPPPKAQPALECKDVWSPSSRLSSLAAGRAGLLRARGSASDRGCGGVRRVDVTVERRVHGRCRFLQRDGGLGAARSCRRRGWLRAAGTTRWKLAFRRPLAPGRYTVRVRAIDGAGNVEVTPPERRRDRDRRRVVTRR